MMYVSQAAAARGCAAPRKEAAQELLLGRRRTHTLYRAIYENFILNQT